MLTEAQLQRIKQPLQTAIGLPGYAYRDPAFLAHELERIFGRMWFSIGHAARLPAKGDVMPVEVGGMPLLIARGQDNNLRVFHNVCRHRGLKLIDRAQRLSHGSIVCPYHGWTYRLDGRCVAIPYWSRATGESLTPDVDADYNLVEVRSRVWLDAVFVDLSGSAPPFDDFIGKRGSRSHPATGRSQLRTSWTPITWPSCIRRPDRSRAPRSMNISF
jgi:choline monooxygenase